MKNYVPSNYDFDTTVLRMSIIIHQTKDGSTTLYSGQFEQFYHNPNGAATESLHVFFDIPGLTDQLSRTDKLTILEIGFGTGLNFLLLADLLLTKKINIPVRFYSVEAFPLQKETAQKLDFTDHLRNAGLADILPEIFDKINPGMNVLTPFKDLDVELHLFFGTFDEFEPLELQADFIFHDPFSPEVNEELWATDTFNKLYSFSKSDTVLSTYCAASKARAAMCVANWFVASTRGALGKREMTVASVSEYKLAEFKRINEDRLRKRYLENDFD